MTDTRYSGWTNRATWLIRIWYEPQDEAELDYIESAINEQYDSMPEGALKDMCGIDEINWDELRESIEEYDHDND